MQIAKIEEKAKAYIVSNGGVFTIFHSFQACG